MPAKSKRATPLQIKLSAPMKAIIEKAATQRGQTVADFAASALVDTARRIVDQESVTVLSRRDRDLFLALINDDTAEPNEALKKAASEYKKSRG